MRTVKIATNAFLVEDHPHTIAFNIERARDYIAQAGTRGADILCLPEMVTTTNVAPPFTYFAEDFPGEHTQAFCSQAKTFGINVIAPYFVRAEGKIFNQATVIDRGGNVVGWYRKVQPTAAESQQIASGSELPVFTLDFGKIAVMICLDIYFPEIPRIYAAKGAEVLFWPTVTHGPTQEALRTQITARALDNSLIMVEANLAGHPPYAPYNGRYRPAMARIIDHNGDIIAQTGRRHGIAIAEVDLDEIRLTSGCILIREPDHIREDLQRLTRFELFAKEYRELAKKQDKYY